jgi:uncharacterized protein (TIGR00661 family)
MELMKVLYAIQGTGNGHVCRAREIVPLLKRNADVDVLISGIQSDVQLPFDVKYVFKGLSYIFGKKGGIDLLATYKRNRIRNLLKEIKELPVEEYDLVISDFEPVSSWACYVRNKPCIALSHQAAVLNKNFPHPKQTDAVGRAILKSYAPSSARYGFHFGSYDENIFTPVIRKEVREIPVTDDGHYTVYLPAYSDKRIIGMLSRCEGVRWEIFSKHFEHEVNAENISIFPVNNEAFIQSLASSHGVICGAGFETPAEALFLNKKLLVIPMKNQYEQHCNAAALKELGVPVIKSLRQKNLPAITEWLRSDTKIEVNYPDNTEAMLHHILQTHSVPAVNEPADVADEKFGVKNFRNLTLKRIISKLGT